MTKTLTLTQVTTPDALAKQLGWSERRVRDKARELGACRILGNRMIMLPAGGRRALGESMEKSRFIGFSGFAPCPSVHVCPERLRNVQAQWHKTDTASFPPRSCLHFVRFESLHDQRFQNAVRVFGPPDFLHRYWDRRALREIADGDVIVFAKGGAGQPFVTFNGDDEAYALPFASDSALIRRD